MTTRVVLIVLLALVAHTSAQTTTTAATTTAATTTAATTVAGATTTAATTTAGATTTAATTVAATTTAAVTTVAATTVAATTVAATTAAVTPAVTAAPSVPFVPLPLSNPVSTSGSTGGCSDSHVNCGFWAGVGQCTSNPWWMKPNCQKSCGSCGCTTATAGTCKSTLPAGTSTGTGTQPTGNTDSNPLCGFWANAGECTKNAPYMTLYCKKSCPSTGQPKPTGSSTKPVSTVNSGGKPQTSGSTSCSDSSQYASQCATWAKQGDCDTNPFWMKPNCQKSCGTCGCTMAQAGTSVAPCKTNVSGGSTQPSTGGGGGGGSTSGCSDSNLSCAFWASINECTVNPSWMGTNCKKACKKC